MGHYENKRRVVVTGLGVVSSLGIGWQKFWKNLIAGKSGISKITAFDTSGYDRHYAGEIKDFDPEEFINPKRVKIMGHASQLAISASKLALRDGKLPDKDLDNYRIGVVLGTTMGESRVIENIIENNVRLNEMDAQAMLALAYPANALSINTANELKLSGDNLVFSNACSAGNYAISRAFALIRLGRVDYMLAGGADALSRVAFTGFGRLFAMAPEKCQPFDKNRQGMMTGEGAAIVLLESLESAIKRGAKIYTEILGYGFSCNTQDLTLPSVEGIIKAVRHALINSHLKEDEVDYINAHGTGTLENDVAECRAIKTVFGKRCSRIPVSSIKSMLGHTMGAAAAFETIACCLAIDKGRIPPTINFEEKDPNCDIDCVPNKSRAHSIQIALNNSQAFGGSNACLALSDLK